MMPTIMIPTMIRISTIIRIPTIMIPTMMRISTIIRIPTKTVYVEISCWIANQVNSLW